VGHSQRKVTDVSFETQVADVIAVADHCGAARFDLLAFGDGALVAAAYAARNPGRVRRLCLVSPNQGGELWLAVAALIRVSWGLGRRTLADLSGCGELERDARTWWIDQIARQVSQHVAALYADELSRSVLPQGLERVPGETLVLHVGEDVRGSMEMSRTLAAAVPIAHLAMAKSFAAEQVSDIVRRFFDEPDGSVAATVAAASGVQTILFTDIERSTELTQRLGDRAAQEVLRAHNTAVRAALAQHAGTEIKHTGDGIMAAFSTASAGVECAMAIQRTLAAVSSDDTPLRVRVGLNAGEPVTEERDLFGTAVQLARRVCDAAQPSEILVSNVVRELCAGKNFRFADRGMTALKGFTDPVPLFAVSWEA
jgi:class 3 adenylate cyclase